MYKSVLKYLNEQSPEVKIRLTRYFSDEVEEFSILTAKLIETLLHYNSQNHVYDENDPKQVAFSLMTKGANSLMAGFDLVLAGYMWEPPVLFRCTLEGFATAWDIVHNEARFATWKAGKNYASSDSISNVKRAIEPFGKLYGYMSNMNVHTCPLNSSPVMLVSGQEPKFQFFGFIPSGKENVRKADIYFALLVAYVCLQLTELVFHNYCLELETIERKPGTGYVKVKVSSRHRRFADTAFQVFKTMSEDPSICY